MNTGTREQEICQLQWDWEIDIPELDTSVFLIPAEIVKNKEDRLVVQNKVAHSVIDAQRGKHPTRVFTYHGQPLAGMYNTAWKRGRTEAANAIAHKNGETVA